MRVLFMFTQSLRLFEEGKEIGEKVRLRWMRGRRAELRKWGKDEEVRETEREGEKK